VKGGMFVLNGHVNEPSLMILNFSSAQKKFSLFIGNESVTIIGDIENLSAMQVKGSSSEADFIAFEQTFNNYFAQLNQLSQLSNSPDAASKRDSIGQAYQKVAMEIQSNVDNFIQQRKSSYVSPFLLVVINQLSDDVFLLSDGITVCHLSCNKAYTDPISGNKLTTVRLVQSERRLWISHKRIQPDCP
jgi:hypothetical protein